MTCILLLLTQAKQTPLSKVQRAGKMATFNPSGHKYACILTAKVRLQPGHKYMSLAKWMIVDIFLNYVESLKRIHLVCAR